MPQAVPREWLATITGNTAQTAALRTKRTSALLLNQVLDKTNECTVLLAFSCNFLHSV